MDKMWCRRHVTMTWLIARTLNDEDDDTDDVDCDEEEEEEEKEEEEENGELRRIRARASR